MRPASRMIFRLLLISEDPNLIASVHALEHRHPVRSRGGDGIELPDRSVEVTFVSSLASALASVQAALATNLPFEIVVVDRACSGIRNEPVVRELWQATPRLCVIDCRTDAAEAGDQESTDTRLPQSVTANHGRWFRLDRDTDSDQLTQLVDTLLDRAAYRQRCGAMQAELGRMNRWLDDLEEQNQSLTEQLARQRLKQKDHPRQASSIHPVRRADFETILAERRSSGPAVRRVTVACETTATPEPPPRLTSSRASVTPQIRHHDASDETRLSGRVLVVDDVPGNRRLATFLLEHAGATVVQAGSGQTMLDLFNASLTSEQPFDAIVLHMAMQEMDGYECARQLRMRGYAGPIVAATACGLPLDRHLCTNAGCDEFVTMPLDRNQFIRTLRRMLKSPPATV